MGGGVGFFLKRSFKRGMPAFIIVAPTFTSPPRSLKSHIVLVHHLNEMPIGHSGKSLFFPKTSVAIVILFWLKWAGYLAVAGLNLLAQLSDRRSPYGV